MLTFSQWGKIHGKQSLIISNRHGKWSNFISLKGTNTCHLAIANWNMLQSVLWRYLRLFLKDDGCGLCCNRVWKQLWVTMIQTKCRSGKKSASLRPVLFHRKCSSVEPSILKGLSVSLLTKRPETTVIYYQSGFIFFPLPIHFWAVTEHLVCLVAMIMLRSHLTMERSGKLRRNTLWCHKFEMEVCFCISARNIR